MNKWFLGHWYWNCAFPDFYWFLVDFLGRKGVKINKSSEKYLAVVLEFFFLAKCVPYRPCRCETHFSSCQNLQKIIENPENVFQNQSKNEGRNKKAFRDQLSCFFVDLGSIWGPKSVKNQWKTVSIFWLKKGKRKRGPKVGPRELRPSSNHDQGTARGALFSNPGSLGGRGVRGKTTNRPECWGSNTLWAKGPANLKK